MSRSEGYVQDASAPAGLDRAEIESRLSYSGA